MFKNYFNIKGLPFLAANKMLYLKGEEVKDNKGRKTPVSIALSKVKKKEYFLSFDVVLNKEEKEFVERVNHNSLFYFQIRKKYVTSL